MTILGRQIMLSAILFMPLCAFSEEPQLDKMSREVGVATAPGPARQQAKTTAICPSWPTAEKNLKLHNYKISKLSTIGIQRTVSYLAQRSHKSLNYDATTGYRASTTFYQFVENGHAVGGVPANKSMVILYNANGSCVAQAGGTIEEIASMLDGSADRLSESIAQ
jgi:hypothetical protein